MGYRTVLCWVGMSHTNRIQSIPGPTDWQQKTPSLEWLQGIKLPPVRTSGPEFQGSWHCATAIRKSGASFISTHLECSETRKPRNLAQIIFLSPGYSPGYQKNTKFQSNVITTACVSTKVLFLLCFFTNFPTNSYFNFSGASSIPSTPAMCQASSTHCSSKGKVEARRQTWRHTWSGPRFPYQKVNFSSTPLPKSLSTIHVWHTPGSTNSRESMSTLAWRAVVLEAPLPSTLHDFPSAWQPAELFTSLLGRAAGRPSLGGSATLIYPHGCLAEFGPTSARVSLWGDFPENTFRRKPLSWASWKNGLFHWRNSHYKWYTQAQGHSYTCSLRCYQAS